MPFWTLVCIILVALLIWSCRGILLGIIVIIGGIIIIIVKYILKTIVSLFK